MIRALSCRSASSSRSAALRSVMSEKLVTTPATAPVASNSGSALIEIQFKLPSGLWTPMTTSREGRPVRSVSMAGCVSPERGSRPRAPRERGSIELRPAICSTSRPRILQAAGLQSTMRPSASCITMPSASASKVLRRPCLVAPSALSTCWRCPMDLNATIVQTASPCMTGLADASTSTMEPSRRSRRSADSGVGWCVASVPAIHRRTDSAASPGWNSEIS